jgi:hypothetical protein
MEPVTYENIKSETTLNRVRNHESFEIVGLSGRMDSAVSTIENIIESQGLKCRVYIYGRVAAAGGSFLGGITGLLGIASAIGMAAHNLATLNPDYEIAKHIVDNKLSITYKGK